MTPGTLRSSLLHLHRTKGQALGPRASRRRKRVLRAVREAIGEIRDTPVRCRSDELDRRLLAHPGVERHRDLMVLAGRGGFERLLYFMTKRMLRQGRYYGGLQWDSGETIKIRAASENARRCLFGPYAKGPWVRIPKETP
jgi:hypothetical protein